MTINHLHLFPAWTRVFTGDTRLVVSAAEGFILLSGIVVGMLYATRALLWGWRRSLAHVARRSFLLYAMAVLGQLVLSSYDYVLRDAFNRPSEVPLHYPALVVNAMLQRGYQHHALDLLPLYAALLPLGVLAVFLLHRRATAFVLLGSLLLWQVFRLDPPALAMTRWQPWFHPGIWQLLFVIGVVIGFHRQKFAPRRWIFSASLISSAALLLVLSYLSAFSELWPHVRWLSTDGSLRDRQALGPARVACALLVFAGCYELLRVGKPWLERCLGWLLLPLGRNALIAYAVQAVVVHLVVTLPGYPFPRHDSFWMGCFHVALVLAVVLLTRLAATALTTAQRVARSGSTTQEALDRLWA